MTKTKIACLGLLVGMMGIAATQSASADDNCRRSYRRWFSPFRTQVCGEVLSETQETARIIPYAQEENMPGTIYFAPEANKDLICRSLGYRRYVRGSAVVEETESLVTRSPRANKMTFPVGDETASCLSSIECRK